MKRPFALMGFTYLSTLAVANFLGLNVSAVLCGVFALTAFVSFVSPKLRKAEVIPAAAVCAFAAMLSYSLCCAYIYMPGLKLDGQTLKIQALVCRDEGESSFGRHYYDLAAALPTSLGQRAVGFRLSSDDLQLHPGDTVEFTGTFSLPADAGGYSTRIYQRSNGVFLYCAAEGEIEIVSQRKGIMYYADRVRKALSDSTFSLLSGDAAAVVNGITLGDDSSLSYRAKKSFSMSGVSHLFAVSGLHVSVLSGFLLLLFRRIKLKRLLCPVVTSLAVLFFMAVVGFSPSVTRAGIMCIIFSIGMGIGRKADPLNSLGFSVLVLCVANPFSAANPGLLLSFSATLGIILAAPHIKTLLQKPIKSRRALRISSPAASALAMTLSAILFSLPVTILFLDGVSLISPVTNIICSLPAAVMFICGGIASIINLVPFLHPVAMAFAFVAGICSKLVLFVSEKLSEIPFACVSPQDAYIGIWLCGAMALLAAAVFIRKKRAVILSLLLSVVCLLGGVLCHALLYNGVLETAVISTEKGCSVAAVLDGDAVVIGCGGSYSAFYDMEDFLDSRNVRSIRLLILPRADYEYSSGAKQLIDVFSPEKTVVSGPYLNYSSTEAGNFEELENCLFTLGGRLTIAVTRNGEQSAYTIGYGETEILYCTEDMDMLSQETVRPDVAIYRQELPADYQAVVPSVAIIAGKTEKASQTALRMRRFTDDCLLSGDYRRLVIQTRGANDITIRNEG